MNLNQLEYFISVAEFKNFTHAARQHYISQTAMSQQIKSLEKTIGTALFVRDKHNVELTAAGKVYLGEVKKVVQHANNAMRLARLASAGLQGEITIGFVTGYGKGGLAEHLREFREAFPNVKINLLRNNSSVLLKQVAKGGCDVVFVISSHVHEKFSLERKYITSYPIMAVLPKNHTLANSEKLTYSALEGEDFIMMDPVNQPKEQMQEALLIYKRAGYVPNIVAADGEDETVMLMVASGIGVAVMPEYITQHYVSDTTLKILPLVMPDGSSETLDFEMLWSDRNENPVLRHFLETLG